MSNRMSYYTLAKLTVMLQIGFERIEHIVNQLGIEPAMRINGVAHFDENAVDRIREVLRAQAARTVAHG